MAKGDTEGVDATALRAEVERAVGALEEGRRIRQQLTHAANGVEAAREILDAMERRVKAHLAQIDALLDDPRGVGIADRASYARAARHASRSLTAEPVRSTAPE